MKKERREILRKLMHKQEMGFNELWGNEGTSNGFAYHLKILVEDGLVCKNGDVYCLTHEGKKLCTYIDGENGEKAKFPLLGILAVIYDKDRDMYLLMRRTKEPFFGMWGLIGGKLKFSEYIYECAKGEIKEETGLTCDIELRGIFSSKTYNNKALSYNHQMFIILATNPTGELIEKTREGENKWVKWEDVEELTMFPNVPKVVDVAKGNGFRWIEMDRFQEDDKFVGKSILKDESFGRKV